MPEHGLDVLEYDGHEPEVDQVVILVEPLALFAVVDEEVDIWRHPHGLGGREVDAADAGVGELVANLNGPDACVAWLAAIHAC